MRKWLGHCLGIVACLAFLAALVLTVTECTGCSGEAVLMSRPSEPPRYHYNKELNLWVVENIP